MENPALNPIVVEVRNNYGNQTVYPTCAVGKIFAEIAGSKTLTKETREGMKRLGYVFRVAKPDFDI